jgi:hypothetical protein
MIGMNEEGIKDRDPVSVSQERGWKEGVIEWGGAVSY